MTMWSDHPLFEIVATGQSIDLDLEIKDSTTPNPKGGFYKNKTVLKPGMSAQAKVPQQVAPASESRIMNALTLKVIPMLENIRKDQMAILEKMKMQAPYPEMNETNDAHDFDEEMPKTDITPEDSPF